MACFVCWTKFSVRDELNALSTVVWTYKTVILVYTELPLLLVTN